MINKSLFSSKRPDWATPSDLFDKLDQEFGFTLDVCATSENAKCRRFYSPQDDGLSLRSPWGPGEIIWCNPPYGRGIGDWLARGYHASIELGSTCVFLLPARTDTKWFHEFKDKTAEIRFIKGRIKFVGAGSSAPFPSMILIFKPGQ